MEAALRQAFDRHTKELLRPFLWTLAGIYGSLALTWWLGPAGNVPSFVVAMWVGTATLAGSLAALNHRLAARWSQAVLTGAVLLALNNVTWLLHHTQDFAYTAVYYLIMLSAGIFLLDLRHLIAVVLASLTAWSLLAAQSSEPEVLVRWGYTLYAAGAIAVVAQVIRLRAYARIEELRAKETGQIRAEEEAKRLRAQSQDRKRLLELTAHHVATPLTPLVLSLAQLRHERETLSPNGQAKLDDVQRQVRRLESAVQAVTDAVQSEEPLTSRTNVDIPTWLSQVVALVQATEPTKHPIDVDAAPLQFSLDRTRMTDALRRLLVACKQGKRRIAATLVDGQLELTLECTGEAEGWRDVLRAAKAGEDALTQRDSDTAMSFHVARRHLEAHGGRLDVVPLSSGLRLQASLRPA